MTHGGKLVLFARLLLIHFLASLLFFVVLVSIFIVGCCGNKAIVDPQLISLSFCLKLLLVTRWQYFYEAGQCRDPVPMSGKCQAPALHLHGAGHAQPCQSKNIKI